MTLVLPDNLPVLDGDQIAELRDLDDGAGAVLAQIAGAFVQHAESQLAVLGELLQSENPDLLKIGAVAHGMCSGAGSVGARRLAQLCHQIQADFRAGDTSNVVACLPMIRSEFVAARSALAAIT